MENRTVRAIFGASFRKYGMRFKTIPSFFFNSLQYGKVIGPSPTTLNFKVLFYKINLQHFHSGYLCKRQAPLIIELRGFSHRRPTVPILVLFFDAPPIINGRPKFNLKNTYKNTGNKSKSDN